MRRALWIFPLVYWFAVILACGGSPQPQETETAGRSDGSSFRQWRAQQQATGALEPEVRTVHDEFTGTAHVRYTSGMNWEDGDAPGVQRPRLSVIIEPTTGAGLMMISASADRWRWLECHRTDLLVSGQRLELGDAEHSGRVGRGYVLEHVSVDLSRQDVASITQAESFRVRVCNDVMHLDDDGLAALHQLAVEIAAAAPATPIATADAGLDGATPPPQAN